MNDIPLHPAIVHLPIGLAAVLPLVALGIVVAVWRGKLPAMAFAVVVGLQALVVGGGLLAMNSGEEDEEKVEQVVDERHIEAHEEAAEAFVWMAGVTLALGISALLLPGAAGRWALVVTTAATVAVAALALRAGKAGGELVYVHGAAAAHTGSSPAGPAAGPAPEGEREGGEHEAGEHEEHEDDD